MAKKSSLARIIYNKIAGAIDKIILWWTAKWFGFLVAVFVSFFARKRMSHDNGIAGLGALRIVDDPKFPAHDFFAPGKEYPVRIRHATATYLDDAVNGIRSIAIKFSHHHFRSPFDIEMNAGPTTLFWSALSFLKFGAMKKEKWAIAYVEYIRRYPEGVKGSIGALRRDPTSYTTMIYYCKTPFLFIGNDGIKRYAKYRVIPANGEPETGLQVDPCEYEMPNQRVAPHNKNGRNYLKHEYEDRVKREGAHYTLQIQLLTAHDDEDPEVFNNMILWDEKIYPWHDLANFSITETLDWKESTLSTFSVNNMPKSLGVLPAKSIYDYNSLNYMRAHSEIARKARLLSYRVFGMVPPIPDNDNRNSEVWGA